MGRNGTVPQRTRKASVSLVLGFVCGFVFGLVAAWVCWVEREARMVRRPERLGWAEESFPARAANGTRKERSAEVEPEDLTRIEGIGPKISSVLEDRGVITYQQLADSDPGALRQMLRDEGLHFADPDTWPEQAALAAVEAWEALEALQDQLSAGRRVDQT